MTPGIPTTKQLTLDDLKAIRLEISQRYEEGMNMAEKRFQLGSSNPDSLTQSQFDDAVGELQKLKLQSTKLLGLIMNMKLDFLLDTNKDSPASKIAAATKSLKEATKKIEDFLEFLQKIAEVIRIAAGIIVAIQSGITAKI
jgi:predicted Zn-dependent protease